MNDTLWHLSNLLSALPSMITAEIPCHPVYRPLLFDMIKLPTCYTCLLLAADSRLKILHTSLPHSTIAVIAVSMHRFPTDEALIVALFAESVFYGYVLRISSCIPHSDANIIL